MLATISSFFSNNLAPFSFLVVAIASSFSSVPMQSLRSMVEDLIVSNSSACSAYSLASKLVAEHMVRDHPG